MNRKFLIIMFFGLTLITSLVVYLSFDNPSNSKQNKTVKPQENMNTIDPINPTGSANSYASESSFFQTGDGKDFSEFLEGLRIGEYNIVWEIWELRRKCPTEYSANQCNDMVLSYINSTYANQEEMKKLITDYFRYEQEIRQLKISPELKFDESYELIKKKRREVLGENTAELFFGMEESQVSFLDTSKRFIDSSKDLSPDERVKQYEELKKKVYGNYYSSLVKREDKYDHYTTELELRTKEFENLSEEDKEKKLVTLETKYFGKERAELMAKNRKESKEEENKISDYQKKEKELLEQNQNLSEKEKSEKLMELRVQHFGKEEAESYTRRLEFEKQ